MACEYFRFMICYLVNSLFGYNNLKLHKKNCCLKRKKIINKISHSYPFVWFESMRFLCNIFFLIWCEKWSFKENIKKVITDLMFVKEKLKISHFTYFLIFLLLSKKNFIAALHAFFI